MKEGADKETIAVGLAEENCTAKLARQVWIGIAFAF